MAFIALTANWESPPQVFYEFQTTIVTSASGREQRRALRRNPRRRISFDAVLAGDTRREVIPFLSTYQRTENRIGDFTAEAARLVDPHLGTEDVLRLDHHPSWANPGAFVTVVDRLRVSEYQIETLSSSSSVPTLYLANALGRSWSAQTRVYPSVRGYLRPSIEAARITNDVTTLPVEFLVSPGSETVSMGTFSGQQVYGREWITKRPNWAGELTETFLADSVDIDYNRGRIARFTPNIHPGRQFALDYVARSRDEAEYLIGVFLRMKGRRGEFCIPTWTNDFTLSTATPEGGYTLRTSNRRFGQAYLNDPVFKTLTVVGTDGLPQPPLRMDLIASDSSGTTVTVDRPFPDGLTASAVQQICLAPVVRFASDELQVTWLTDSIARIRFTCQTVRFLPSEDAQLDAGSSWLISLYGWEFLDEEMIDPIQIAVNETYPMIGVTSDGNCGRDAGEDYQVRDEPCAPERDRQRAGERH